jgi:hypothetical protein
MKPQRNFCTVFDKNYLIQGLALFDSLNNSLDNFRLYVLCLDAMTLEILEALKLEKLVPVFFEKALSSDLVSIMRKKMTYPQFCWAGQPMICEYVLRHTQAEMVTYVEADSFFFSSPEPLFEELGKGSITLSPHNYQNKYDKSKTSGIFCTQFNTFRADDQGFIALEMWKKLNLAYSKSAPESFPGQKGLDDWPSKFSRAVVIKNPGAGVAPWNVNKYKFRQEGRYVDQHPIIFYHFHSYARCDSGEHHLGDYPLPNQVINTVYRDYILALRLALINVLQVAPEFNFRRNRSGGIVTIYDLISNPSFTTMKIYLHQIRLRIQGRFNIYPDSYFK